MKLTILIADTNANDVERLRAVLQDIPDVEIIAHAADAAEAVGLAARLQPSVVVVGEALSRESGFAATRTISGAQRNTAIVSRVSSTGTDFITQAIEAGAAGFVSKSAAPAEVESILRRSVEGAAILPAGMRSAHSVPDASAPNLTLRERDVLALVAQGLTTGRSPWNLGSESARLATMSAQS